MRQLVNVRVRVRPVTLHDHEDGIPGLEFGLIGFIKQPGCVDQSYSAPFVHSTLPIDESAVEQFMETLRLEIVDPILRESISAEFLAALHPYREYVPHPLLAAD